MKKIFLASSFEDVVDTFKEFANEELRGKTVTFIPTASLPEKVTFYVKSAKKQLESLGMLVQLVELSTAAFDEIKNALEQNDYIYVSGGNSFFLLQELRKSGADQLISTQVALGKSYIGESAGAIVTSPNIAYSTAMDAPEKAPDLTDFTGLSLVDFYPVPHYTNSPFKKTVEGILTQHQANLNLIPISNQQAILINGGTTEII